MKNKIYFVLAAVLFIAACGKKTETALDVKRAELDSLESELVKINDAITGVKAEIAELDTVARPNAIAVMAMEIAKGQFKNPFQIQGLVESDQNVMVSPEVPGNLVKIFVKEGQKVSKGQVIASIDGSVASSQISELENALSLAKINLSRPIRWQSRVPENTWYMQHPQ